MNDLLSMICSYRVYLWRFTCCSALLAGMTACSIAKVSEQVALVEGVVEVSGTVVNESGQEGRVHVTLYRFNGTALEAVSLQVLAGDGSFSFEVTPGVYALGAFVDADKDGDRDAKEPATYFGEEQAKVKLINVKQNQPRELPVLVVSTANFRQPDMSAVDNLALSIANIGQVVSLDDARFTDGYSSMGLWTPVDFLDQVGAGLFMLQPFEEGKIPVIFVHGITGNPTNFAHLVAALDRDHFQPWVLYYPSGLRLNMVSDYFLRSVSQIHAQNPFSEVYVVAHSMGGLMTRSFVHKNQQSRSPIKLGLVVTINSPLYGIDSAASGVKTSPIVLPVWRDVASQSDYVKQVHATAWPADVPYHLFFSYQKGEDGDGVVPMTSQLSRSLQREAQRIYGYNAEHSGILKNREFISELNQILARAVAEHQAQ